MTMILNPTLRLRWSPGDARARALWLTRHAGPRALELDAKVAAALLALEAGAAIERLFEPAAVAWLRRRELLIDEPGPQPGAWRPALAELEPASSDGPARRWDPDFVIEREPETGAWLCERSPWPGPDWLRLALAPSEADELAGIALGRRPSPALEARLQALGALASPAQASARRARRLQWLIELRDAFARTGWARSRSWPPPAELEPLIRWARARLDYGYLDGDLDIDDKRRLHLFDPPQLASLHARAAVLASAIAGRRLVPSYTFLAFYLRGGALPRHRDKPHCAASMSLALSAAPSWPLVLEPLARPASVLHLATGDLLLFDGRRLAHSRPPLDEDLAIHLILHFRADPEALA